MSLQQQEDIMTDEPRAGSAPKEMDADRHAGTPTQGAPPGSEPTVQGGEAPPATLEEIGAAARKTETSGATREAIDRATAPNGQDAGA
ncbi:hypothetical protein ASF41_04040 [Methylobacterium sp. Leaf111]|nr:hypothetical protein ASF41_04040 [Methylobacterium sp. Leaf111]